MPPTVCVQPEQEAPRDPSAPALLRTTYAGHIGEVVLDHGSLEVLGVTCGNVNLDPLDKINLSDITKLISAVYLGGEPPDPACVGNTNCDALCKLNLSDITTLIDHVYISHRDLCDNCCACAK